MVRPHPVVWRFVLGVVVVYLLSLVWLLFQTVDDARLALTVSLLPRYNPPHEPVKMAL
jgi:hypothetical protein